VILARVIGTVVATVKDASLEGKTLLVVQPLDRQGRDKGKPVVAIDTVGAGVGELIYFCRGREATFPFLPDLVPSDGTIVGSVDRVNIPGTTPAEPRN
jgi:microcompartment protein CcmK/EutM